MEEKQTIYNENFLPFREYILYLRDNLGIKAEELGETFGVDPSTINNWISGKTKKIPIIKIREAMGKLGKRYGLRFGRITSTRIEVLNTQQATFGGDSKIKSDNIAELELLKEQKEILLSDNFRLESENRELRRKLEDNGK